MGTLSVGKLASRLRRYFLSRLGDNTIEGNLYPKDASTLTIGSAAKPFAAIYADNIYGTPSASDSLVAIDSGDGTPGFLADKLLAGTSIGLSLSGTTNKTMTVNLLDHDLLSSHTVSGLTAGTYLRATGATTFAFQSIQDADLPSTIVRTSRQVIAGSGLTGGGALSSDVTINVGAGTGISVAADSVAINTAASLTWTGTHTFNQNIIFPDNKGIYNDSGGGNVYKIILDDSQSRESWVGASGDGGMRFYSDNMVIFTESDANDDVGAMSLNSRWFKWQGNIEIVDNSGNTVHKLDQSDAMFAISGGGDLFVGGSTPSASILHVSGANNNVGILPGNIDGGVADPQFALDVGGPLRAEYLIGPHAIQLEDAEHIWHFDGPGQGSSEGSLSSHMGLLPDSSFPNYGYTFSRGKFGMALTVADNHTNLATNPSVETSDSGWSAWVNSGSGGGGRVAASSRFPASRGQYYFRQYCSSSTGNVGFYTVDVPVSPNTTYTLSIDIRIMALGGTYTPYVREFYSGGNRNLATIQSFTAADADGKWRRISKTVTTSSDATSLRISGYLYNRGEVHYDAFQVTQTGYELPYCDGSLGPGYSWSGTAHASTSSNTDTLVRYRVQAHSVMTLMLWKRHYTLSSGDRHWDVRWYNETKSDRQLLVGYANSGWDFSRFYASIDDGYGTGFTAYTGDVTDAPNAVGTSWHHYAVVVNLPNQSIKYYFDGKLIASKTTTVTSFGDYPWNVLMFGDATGGGGPWSIDVDDVVIQSRAMEDDEIRAVYESKAPVFAESSVFSWRAPTRSPVWVDGDGLWAKSEDGIAVFGVYAGDSSTTWGNITMSTGDVLIGNNTDGYVWFDKDTSSATKLKIKAEVDIEGDSNLNGKLTISSSGGLYIGSGSFASPSDGIKMWDGGSLGNVSVFYGSNKVADLYRNGLDLESDSSKIATGYRVSWWRDLGSKTWNSGYIGVSDGGSGGSMEIMAFGNTGSSIRVESGTGLNTSNVLLESSSSDGRISMYFDRLALGTGGHPSSSYRGIYYNNTADDRTSMHLFQRAWSNAHVIAYGAHYLQGTGSIEVESDWYVDYDAGSYRFGPGMLSYFGNGGSWVFYIGAQSSGVGSQPGWSRKLELRRDNYHKAYGKLTVISDGVHGVMLGGGQSGVGSSGVSMIDLGYGWSRESNAGKITIGTFVANSLNIVGFATAADGYTKRKIDFWNEGGMTMRGNVSIIAGGTAAGDLSVAGTITSATSTGTITWDGDYNSGSTGHLYKNADTVEMYMRIQANYADSSWRFADIVATLPSGYRPKGTFEMSTVDSSGYWVRIRVNSSGTVEIAQATGSGKGTYIYFTAAFIAA